jgi:toxin CcdB
MAQFTVYRNKNAHTKSTFPLLVDVQSELLEDLKTRVVIPLTKSGALARRPLSQLMPVIRFEEDTYVLLTPQLAGIARSDLGTAVGTLVGQRDTIVAAMDFLIVGF